MKIIYLKVKNSITKNTSEVKNNLLWYDVVNKKMMQFQGGKLKFTPNRQNDAYQVSAESTKVERMQNKSNNFVLQRWIYANDIKINDFESDGNQIAIEVEDNDYNRIIDDLQSSNIEFTE